MSKKFIRIIEKGETVFRFPDEDNGSVSKHIAEIVAMEIIRGDGKANKSTAIKHAIAFYREALKRGLTHEHDETLFTLPARTDEHPDVGDADQ